MLPNPAISPLEHIAGHPGAAAGVSLFVKRDDLLHPEVQGNKWRKLAPMLEKVKRDFPGGIITFGGPFSNHLHAVAAAGRLFDIPTFGIVRGEHADLDNPTLSAARWNGMMLFRVSKQEYDACKHRGHELISPEFPQYYILPEGGATPEGVGGCAEISREIHAQLCEQGFRPSAHAPLYLCVSAGTGCTAAGIVQGFGDCPGQVLVFPVVNRGFDTASVLQHLEHAHSRAELEKLERRFSLVREYEFGGFAKKNAQVLAFAEAFRRQTGILPDPVYTSKMLFGVYDMLARGDFPAGSAVVAVHTGGLQGWGGMR